MTLSSDQIEAERAPWLIADKQISPDIGEFADAIGMSETIREMWRSAFVAGWRNRDASAKSTPVLVTPEMVERGARAAFTNDWPKDTWERLGPGAAQRRYLTGAQLSLDAALNPGAP